MEGNEQVMSGEIREEVEWCNIRWFDGADTGKRVLLIGDSITLGYGNVVCEKLKEKQIRHGFAHQRASTTLHFERKSSMR